MADVGRVVQTVSNVCTLTRIFRGASTDPKSSPLYRHISSGRVITYLDEVRMGGDSDTWSKYLQGEISDDDTRGWCIDKSAFTGTSSDVGVRSG